MIFSTSLKKAVRREIEIQIQGLDGQHEGVEETIGDNLSGADKIEFDGWVEITGFEAVCKNIKKEYL